MTWPKSLSSINSNMNTTELWALKEQMVSQDLEMTLLTSFAEQTTWRTTLTATNESFDIEESFEMIVRIMRVEE